MGDGPDAKEVFESCPLGSEAASIAAQALEILETMEQRGVMPDGIEGNQWIPSVKIQVDEEARKLGKEQMQVEKRFEAIIEENKARIAEEKGKRIAMEKQLWSTQPQIAQRQ